MIFYSLEVVGRCRETQLRVRKNFNHINYRFEGLMDYQILTTGQNPTNNLKIKIILLLSHFH